MTTLKDKLRQASDRDLIYRFGNLHLTALSDILGRDVQQSAQAGDNIFKFLYDAAQVEDKDQRFYSILIEPFAAMKGAL